MSTRYTDQQYAEALQKKLTDGGLDEDEFDVDDAPVVANGVDSGAYVQLWHWLSDDELEAMGFTSQPQEPEDTERDDIVCRYSDCPVGDRVQNEDDEPITCPHCRKDLGLPPLA